MATESGASVVAIVSPKGGVGKTTLAANLASELVQRGRPALLLDLDPQNALRLHHRMPLDDPGGIAVQALEGRPWREAIQQGPFGADILAFGTLAEPDRHEFEMLLMRDPNWLRQGLAELGLAPGTAVLVDTPPGGSPYALQALAAAHIVLGIVLPDAASYVTIPTMERWLTEYCRGRADFRSAFYVVNRMNNARVLCRDVQAALYLNFGDRLAPSPVEFDAAVEEALATQMPVAKYAPGSAATRSLAALADWLAAKL